MNRAKWARVAEVFDSAVRRPPGERSAYLDAACGVDADLRREVEGLLQGDDSGSAIIDKPIADTVLGWLDDNARVLPGQHLGPFRIDGLLGVGGMGEVYRARDTRLNRDVAIKVLPTAFALDPDRLARFKREAQVLASLNHPNIAAIYGLEEAPSSGPAGLAGLAGQVGPAALTIPCIVMELVEGPTLAELIAEAGSRDALKPGAGSLKPESRGLPVAEALAVARQIAEALEAAHEQGIIHRDLKPANIKVRDDGTVKVLDFGLAKALDQAGAGQAGRAGGAAGLDRPGPPGLPDLSQSPTITTPAMTAAGVILGTAAYMSPEQAKGKPADKRSDIWAFGCVLFEMLTGARAFPGEDVAETLAEIIKGTPDWSLLPSTVSPQVRQVLERCLTRDPRRRLRAVSTIAFLLEEPEVPLESPRRTEPWRPGVLALAVAVAMLLGAAVARLWWADQSPERLARLSVVLPSGQQFTMAGMQTLTISPDGQTIAYVANRQIFLRPLAQAEARSIPGTEQPTGLIANPVFSPDGTALVFWAGTTRTQGALYRIELGGGAPQTLTATSYPLGLNWEGDTLLFATYEQGVMSVPASGGSPAVVLRATSDERFHGPQMLPDGRHLLATLAHAPEGADLAPPVWEQAAVVIHDLGSGERRVIVEQASDARYLSSGHLLYTQQGIVMAVPFDPARLSVLGPARPVIEGVLRTGNLAASARTGTTQLAVAANGTAIFIPGPSSLVDRSALILTDRRGRVESLGLPLDYYEQPRVAPDGRHVAFVTADGAQSSIWVYELGGASAPRRLTLDGRNQAPVWSPDGTRLAFQSQQGGRTAIYTHRADGSGRSERLFEPEPDVEYRPEAWAATPEALVFSEKRQDRYSLAILRTADRSIVRYPSISSGNLLNADLSPDGKWLLYSRSENPPLAGPILMERFPPTGGDRYEVAPNGSQPHWATGGREVIFNPAPGRIVSLALHLPPDFSLSVPQSFPKTFTQGGPLRPRNFSALPDGRLVAVAAQGQGVTSSAQSIEVMLNWLTELKKKVPVP